MSDIIKWLYDKSDFGKVISFRGISASTAGSEVISVNPKDEWGDGTKIAVTDFFFPYHIAGNDIVDYIILEARDISQYGYPSHALIYNLYPQTVNKMPTIIQYNSPPIGKENGKLKHKGNSTNLNTIYYLVGYFVLGGKVNP